VAAAREDWKAGQAGLDPTKLVFIDETGANTKMTRAYGRCALGRRLVCKTPWGHWKTTTFTCGLRCDGLVAPWVLDGPMNGDAFRVYVERVLAPTLSPGDIVVMDNLGSHKVDGIRQAIEAAGGILQQLASRLSALILASPLFPFSAQKLCAGEIGSPAARRSSS
jgi:hypothetical protein